MRFEIVERYFIIDRDSDLCPETLHKEILLPEYKLLLKADIVLSVRGANQTVSEVRFFLRDKSHAVDSFYGWVALNVSREGTIPLKTRIISAIRDKMEYLNTTLEWLGEEKMPIREVQIPKIEESMLEIDLSVLELF